MKKNLRLPSKLGVKSLYSALMALALAAVVVLNILCGALADRYPLSLDLTGDKLFELGQETVDYIAALTGPVQIQVLATEERFANTSVYNAQANEVMRQFAKRSGAIDISYIDYISDPTFAARYPDLTMKHGDVLVTSGDRVRLVKTEELFQYGYTSGGQLAIAASRAEEAILSAVLYVTSSDVPKAAVLQGHGETAVDAFETLLASNNYEIVHVNLLTGQLPEDTDLLLLAAPATDLSEEELDLLDRFLENGGAYGKLLFYCASPQQGPLPNLESFLAEWGVAAGDGLVFETDANRVYATQPFYAVADPVSERYAHLTRDGAAPMLVPVSRPLEVLFSQRESYYTETLLQFGASSGVRPGDAPEGFTADDAAQRGPLPALVLSSRRVMDPANAATVLARSCVLTSGSVELLADYAVGTPSFANGQYLVGLLNELCGNDGAVSVTPKRILGSALNITQGQADGVGYFFVLGIPAAALLLGIAVWLTRRHR